jgi:hypothetical protein
MLSHFLSLPALVILLLVMAGFIAISLTVLYIFQKHCRGLLFADHTDFAAIFSAALGIVFGLILAFVTITTWQSYSTVGSAVTKEADSLSPMYKLLDAYPSSVQKQGQVLLQKYITEVIVGDWAAMANGTYNSVSY